MRFFSPLSLHRSHVRHIAFPRLCNVVLGDVPPYQAGLAAGIGNAASQVSAAAIGSRFFFPLDAAPGERDYGFAFTQSTRTAALFAAMLIAIPRRREAMPAALETRRR